MPQYSILSALWLFPYFSTYYLQGKEIIEHFINELKKEGVTYLPPWSEPHKAIQDDDYDDDDDDEEDDNHLRYCITLLE
jgi:hypothetical protein